MPGLDTQKLINKLVEKVQSVTVEIVVLQAENAQLKEQIEQLAQSLAAVSGEEELEEDD